MRTFGTLFCALCLSALLSGLLSGCSTIVDLYLINDTAEPVGLTVALHPITGTNSMLHFRYADAILTLDAKAKEKLTGQLVYTVQDSTTVTLTLPPHSTTLLGTNTDLRTQVLWLEFTNPQGSVSVAGDSIETIGRQEENPANGDYRAVALQWLFDSGRTRTTGTIDREVAAIQAALDAGELRKRELDQMSYYGGAVTGYRDSTGSLRYVDSYASSETGMRTLAFFLSEGEPIYAAYKQFSYRQDTAGFHHLEDPQLLVEEFFWLNKRSVLKTQRLPAPGNPVKAEQTNEADPYSAADLFRSVGG